MFWWMYVYTSFDKTVKTNALKEQTQNTCITCLASSLLSICFALVISYVICVGATSSKSIYMCVCVCIAYAIAYATGNKERICI